MIIMFEIFFTKWENFGYGSTPDWLHICRILHEVKLIDAESLETVESISFKLILFCFVMNFIVFEKKTSNLFMKK